MIYNLSVEVVKAFEPDIDQILSLQAQIYRVTSRAQNAHEYLKQQLTNTSCEVLVAKSNGQAIATATLYFIDVAIRGKSYALLEGLVVDEKHRGQGVGTEFFKKITEIARVKGCYKMIFTSAASRASAHAFYEKMGFKRWGLEFRMDF